VCSAPDPAEGTSQGEITGFADVTAAGQSFWVLSINDDFTKGSLAVATETGFPAR